MFNFLSNLISSTSAGHGTSFLSVGLGSMFFNVVRDLAVTVYNFFLGIIWFVLKWFLGALDAMQHIVTSFLGIDTTGPIYNSEGVLVAEGNSVSVGEIVTEFKTIFSGGNSYFDILMSIFRALTVVAIILMIVFAIFAMVMQEWRIAEQQKYTPDKNDKVKIVKNVGINILTILLMPLTFYFVIIGTNSILTSFYRAIGNEAGVSIGGQVLASSTYDANRYRTYANANKRIPITIEVYDPTDADANKKIKSDNVQNQLKAIAGAFANNSFLSFEKSTMFDGSPQYSGSVFRYNNQTYAYGDEPNNPDSTVDQYIGTVFENFICTREQYYIMADFVDYCQMHNMPYYIKAISESDIDWKYVDSAVVTADEMQPNGTALGEVKLTIKYRDASFVANEAASAANGANDSYSLTFTTEKQVVSAVSDALTTISTLLGLGDDPAMYNTMERDDSGDYTNLVSWANEKAILKLSPSFNINDATNWTYTDQMIIYEYFKYSSNNTLEKYTLDELKTTGAEIDVQILTFRKLGSYFFDPDPIYCIKLNGSYYKVQKSSGSNIKVDAYGNPYYEFVEPSTKYFRDGAIQIEKLSTKTNIKLSSGFNINNNANWTVSDCILVYEYFSNLSLSNELRRYKFTDFYNSGSGVDFTVFKIKDGLAGSSSEKYYIYINNTYYQVNSSYKLPSTTNNFTTNSTGNFMVNADESSSVTYNFKLSFTNSERYGLPVDNGGNLDASKVYKSSVSYDSSYEIENDVFYTKYANVNLKLSNTFDFTNSETWTYRDYLIFYIYSISNNNSNVEMLKINGILGNIVKETSTNKYYLKTSELLTTGSNNSYYLDLDTFEKVSDFRIQSTLEDSIYEDLRLDMSGVGVEISYDTSDKFYRAKTEVKLFEFSDDFDEFNPETWTVGDYYLCYFSNQGVISNLNVIKNNGYSSLVYEIVDGASSYKLYRFGGNSSKYHYINSAILPTYVINEDKGILGQHTIESFFETNLMNYVFSSYLTSSAVDNILSYSDTDFLNMVYEKYTGYVYKLDANVDSPSSLIKKLVETKFAAKTTEIANYTYKNATFALADPSTWTDMDIAIYAITGTNSGAYTSRLIKTDDGKIYFLVGNYLLNISAGSRYECTINSLATLSSTGCKFVSDATAELNGLWSSRLSGMVVSSINGETLLSNAEFTYTTKIDLRSSATFLVNTQYTELDMIIYKLGLGEYASDATPHQYKSYVYKDTNGDAYIKLGSYYIKAYPYDFGSVVYSQGNSIALKSTTNFVTDTGTKYTSTKYVSSNYIQTYKYLDAFIFDKLGEIQEKEYKIFQINGVKYIYVAGYFINIAGTTSTIPSPESLITNDRAKNEKYVQYIYDTYYAKYSISIPSYAPASKVNVSEASTGYVIDLNSISTWTPLGIILYANGLIENNKKIHESYNAVTPGEVVDMNVGVTAEMFKSGDETKLYLFVHKTDAAGETTNYYFDITTLVQGTNLNVTKLANIEMQLRLATCEYDTTNEVVVGKNVSSTISTHATDIVNDKTEYTTLQKYEADLTLTRSTPNSWTWLELLYYYYNGSAATGTVYIERLFANDKMFLVFKRGTATHYYELTTELTTAFTMSSEKTAQYGIDSQITSLVIESASGKDNCRYREVTTTDGTKIYYFQDAFSEYYAVYGLSSDIKQSLEEYKVYTKTISGTPATTVRELLTQTQASTNGFTSVGRDTIFTYISKDFEELGDWSILDFVVGYLKTSSSPQYVNTRIYNFGGTNFFKFNGRYVNIFSDEFVEYVVDTSTVGTTYYGEIESTKSLFDLMSLYVFKPNTNSMVSTMFGEVNYDEELITPNFDINNYIIENGTTGQNVTASKYYLEEDGSVSEEPVTVVTGKVIGYKTTLEVGATEKETYSYKSTCEKVNDRYYLNVSYLDLVIFKATGTMPTKNTTYSIKSYEKGSNKYIEVSGLYIKVTDALLTLITPFDNVVDDANNRLDDPSVITSTVIQFSELFDPADFSTWTITDYILYYVFTNGNYKNPDGTNDFEISFPYSYTSSYDEVGDKYSNMTYLDLAIYHATGALPDRDITYNFKVFVDGTTLYLRVSNSMFIDFSEYVKLNTTERTIESAIIPGYVTNLTSSFNEYFSNYTDALKPIQYKDDLSGSAVEYKTKLSAANMQYFVNLGGVYANVYTLTKPDSYGSTTLYTVIDFRNKISPDRGIVYYNYDVLMELYNKKVGSNIKTKQINAVDIDIVSNSSATLKTGLAEYELRVTYDEVIPDFDFENYYYYKLNFDNWGLSGIMDVPDQLKANILKGVYNITGTFNLKLDAGGTGQKTVAQLLDTNLSDWTFRDVIIMLEFSNDVRHNIFKGMEFSEVYTDDYFIDVYSLGDSAHAIYINGNFYNITNFTTKNETTGVYELNTDDTSTPAVNEAKINITYKDEDGNDQEASFAPSDFVSVGNINDYSFRTLVETKKFALNSNYSGYYTVVDDLETIIFSTTVSGKTLTNVKQIRSELLASDAYQLNLFNFEEYKVEPYIKKVSWVQKLMTDMQVYYPDLNWNTLLATDGWLDTLGDYVSAYTTGLYVSDNNSSNVTAAGLVLAEFFMSKATPVYESYANFEYSSMFDQETINALMRSLMGAENFEALEIEAQLFMDFFNSTYAPILDDLSAEFGEAINGDSLRMCVYKSYLATILLSSDIGEYLYTVATRVYSEYTICEYLAGSGGDYAGYFSYVNKLPDETGERTDSYNYGSFAELVQYENEFCGNATPTFTFNFKKAFAKYFNLDDFKITTHYSKMITNLYQANKSSVVSDFNACTNKDQVFKSTDSTTLALKHEEVYHSIVYYLVDKMFVDYESIYDSGKIIGENGYIANTKGETLSTDQSYIYCYMIHVYWTIDQEVTFLPFYVDLYRQYLQGDISRWEIIDDACIEGCDEYISKYLTYEVKLQLYKALSFASLVKLLMPSVALNDEDADNSGLIGLIKSIIESCQNNGAGETFGNLTIVVPAIHGKLMLKGGKVEEDINYIYKNSLLLYFNMFLSEDSSINDFMKEAIQLIAGFFGADIDLTSANAVKNAWDKIVEYDTRLARVIMELEALTDIGLNEKTQNGTVKSFDNPVIEVVINAFKDVKLQIEKYISTQQLLDQIQKRSITFTLAQYGSNYVQSGFNFAVKNKTYTFKSTVDPSRLAEYVYGGAFLESVGVGAQYTSAEFEGIIETSKVYDSKDKVVKTELNCWSKLRGFASELADYTATIYFLTNLGDLSPNYENVVKMTDVNTYDGITTTQEAIILDYFINETEINPETLARLIIPTAEPSAAVTVMSTNTKNYINTISNKDSTTVLTPADYKNAAQDYINTVQTANYTDLTERYYAGSGSQVIHQIFENVLNYMLVTNPGDGAEVKYINYENMTFEGMKREVISAVVTNRQYSDEDSTARAQRYLALFGLVSAQFDYSVNGNYTGRIIKQSQLNLVGSTYSISAKYAASYQTEQSVLTLSGLENRPTTDIVKKQDSGEVRTQFDESDGDVFVVCTYNTKTNLYVPLLASNGNDYTSSTYTDYKNMHYTTIYSDYYQDGVYPIIAKGIITADGYPTAIRKYENPIPITQSTAFGNATTIYNQVTFYRTNLGSTATAGDDYASLSQAVNRVTTKNYTNFTLSTSFTSGVGGGTVYTGEDNIKSSMKSDFAASYVQLNGEYLIVQQDDYGAISVLDDFHNFYTFGGQSLMLCIMALMILFPIIFDASLGVMRRIFDLLFLFIASPMMVAMKSTSEDNKSKSFDIWVRDMQGALFGCMGYIIGFSSYFLLFEAIYGIDSFISIATYQNIAKIGGLGNFITYGLLNSVLRCCWVLAGVYIIKTIPKALLPIVTGNKLTSEDSPIGKGGSMSQRIKQLTSDIQKIASKVGAIMSGKALMQLKDMAIQTAKDSVPGLKLAMGAGRSLKAKREGKEVEKALVEYGVDKDTASKAGKSVSSKKKEALDKKNKKQEDNAKDFKKTFD